MEELQKMIDWIGEYDKEYECFPHPNLIKMRMKLRVEELQKQVNVTLGSVSKCNHKWKTHEEGDKGLICVKCNRQITTF